MNITKQTISRFLWLSTFLLLTALAGCSKNDSRSSQPVPTPSPAPDPVVLTPPTVVSSFPIDASIGVAINSTVTATFSEAVDAATVTASSFTVTGAAQAAVVGTVTLNSAGNVATFVPGSNFGATTAYTATITTAVTNIEGTALAADFVWTFTTSATADTTAPTVDSTDPLDGATAFALNRSVSANFSEELNPDTVNGTSFSLSDGTNAVDGIVTYSNKTATFNPDTDLLASTIYTATLSTAIADLASPANTLATVVWSFTTGESAAQGPAAVNLRTAGNFVILTKTGITNVHTSAITGNIGASPITAAAMDNVFCSEIVGTIYGSDAGYTGSGAITCFAGAAPDNTLVANAVLDMGTAYTDAAGRTTPDFTELHAGDISGQTLAPGLYKWGTGVLISTDVTLSGGANDVWIFQVAGDITQADGSSIVLAGGALAKNIFWQVGGGTGVAIGTTAHFAGIILAEKGITVNTGASVDGRLLSQTAVTLDQNAVTQPAP
ncbi:ice-binding family protein [Simiduia aestuariiviva]|uniref:SbsA Ig-like domain-containing protein n=1 Tax=Simiduia aestuariiviva TaxID=1510459 RepID=A0A839UUH0_9GAMM|nr:ice-binding family protein [Simiduia aestuariiviva]MBB3169005.1 hypothetical protein [Simiduia aestuariiviva]